MRGAADESSGIRRQQCIDVLCGYLRLPYDARDGNSGRTELVVKTPKGSNEPGDLEEHIEYRQNDKTVRQTIVRVIADHLRPEAEYSWSTGDFDFRTAYLEDIDFNKVTFTESTNFSEATFAKDTNFSEVTFSFSKDAYFNEATFSDEALFVGASFARTSFEKATFGNKTVSFADPKQWGPPMPVFDWAKDVTHKPANIEPQDWPPTVAVVVP